MKRTQRDRGVSVSFGVAEVHTEYQYGGARFFLCWVYGKDAMWHALQKKNNVQTHHGYFANFDETRHGQKRPSGFMRMLLHIGDINITIIRPI